MARRSSRVRLLPAPLLTHVRTCGKAEISDRGAGFTLLYLDDDLRMHRTFDGQYFVQQRA